MEQLNTTRGQAEVEIAQIDNKYRKSQELEIKILMLMDLAGIELSESEQNRLETILKFFLDHNPN